MDSINSGQFIGRYAIQKTLGAGAMGVVYLARDPHIERLLAIKTVRLQGGSPAEIADRKQRLLRETKTAGSLIHPHVVTLFDAGEHEDQLFIAFEYVDGSSLGEKLAAEGVPKLGEALRIAREAAEGLGYAHTRGIVHRDVKPANILISSAGQVKVADFGIAKVVGQATELTVTGTVVGSPHYLSPEQVRGEPLDGRSDVFSLGVVFYELLGGTRPFDGETFTTLLYQILHQEPPPIRLKPALVPTVADVLRRMLSKDRNQRYADGNEAAKALAELARNLSPELLASPAVADTHVEPTRLFSTEEISSVMPPPLPPSIGEAATLPAGGPPPPPRPPTAPAP
ncbi:MAG: serine/threonine-protein kinase, partial [Thermoanaerobaculia bacterium]|nr:serine/threonine-protein kinase [Thermoanaerobaculia bacterium]